MSRLTQMGINPVSETSSELTQPFRQLSATSSEAQSNPFNFGQMSATSSEPSMF
jgi:hypothetical protein